MAVTDLELRRLARDIHRCEVLAAVLRGEPEPCQAIGRQQRLGSNAPRYVPEPWAGHLGSAPILFIGSNPAAELHCDPLNHEHTMCDRCSDDDLFTAADGAFDAGGWPGIFAAKYHRDRHGQLIGRWGRYWAWNHRIARELLERDPNPGWDYAITDVVHCASRGQHGVDAALERCTGLYLQRILHTSAAVIIVLAGKKALHAFRNETDVCLIDGTWGPDQLDGKTRCVLDMPHPNQLGPKKGLVDNLRPEQTAVARSLLRAAEL